MIYKLYFFLISKNSFINYFKEITLWFVFHWLSPTALVKVKYQFWLNFTTTDSIKLLIKKLNYIYKSK
jgi:hypothetical protein